MRDRASGGSALHSQEAAIPSTGRDTTEAHRILRFLRGAMAQAQGIHEDGQLPVRGARMSGTQSGERADLCQIEPVRKRPVRIARVFPRITKATPQDELAYFGPPPMLFRPAVDEVHVDCTFTVDKPKAEWLAEQWSAIAPTKIDGVAYENPGQEFVPGLYIKHGYTITSRGCPRRCWFCSVWKRDPTLRTLPIHDGWNVLDDNLLACPEDHVRAVFKMLARQGRQIEFTGGLEALSLQDYQVGLLADMKPRPNCFFAYDPGDGFETLKSAADRLIGAGFTACSHRLRAYVLIGYPKDTFAEAEKRLNQMLSIGFTPHAMLWQPETPAAEKHRPAPEWRAFQRVWARPKMIHAKRHGAGM
jgi:hypothetical protein